MVRRIYPRCFIGGVKFFLNVRKKYLEIVNYLFLSEKKLNYIGVDSVDFMDLKVTLTTCKNII